ncbi:MAG: hypothetical protein R3239_03820, partial [Thermodesulfobacteriota bacterium]|nr:hypothetical protein [Thermodesulfobacteriota bacterium]
AWTPNSYSAPLAPPLYRMLSSRFAIVSSSLFQTGQDAYYSTAGVERGGQRAQQAEGEGAK